MPPRHLALEFIRVGTDAADPSAIRCPSCHHLLAVHQPDVQRPDRLISVCPECDAWFVMYDGADVMARLPPWDAFRDP